MVPKHFKLPLDLVEDDGGREPATRLTLSDLIASSARELSTKSDSEVKPSEASDGQREQHIVKRPLTSSIKTSKMCSLSRLLNLSGAEMEFQYHKDGTLPTDLDSIFVFGSNLAGIHGAGAAKAALQSFGACFGVGEGLMAKSYAIPTKDEDIESLPFARVVEAVNTFISFAKANPQKKFWMTRIGCGLAGFRDEDIAPLFFDAPKNCNMPLDWARFLD